MKSRGRTGDRGKRGVMRVGRTGGRAELWNEERSGTRSAERGVISERVNEEKGTRSEEQ